MTSIKGKKELMLANLGTQKVKRQNEAATRLLDMEYTKLEIKQSLIEVRIREENKNKFGKANIAEVGLEKDSDYFELLLAWQALTGKQQVNANKLVWKMRRI